MAAIQTELNIFLNYTTASGTYNMTSRDVVIACDTSSGSVIINLLSASGNQGQNVNIKDTSGNSSSNNITINPNGNDTIEGQTSAIIANNYDCITLISDGTSNWHII